MSLVVSHYDPWREKIAVDVLGNLLNRYLDRRDKERDNQAMNEAIAAATGTFDGSDSGQAQTAPDALLSTGQGNLMSNPFFGAQNPSTGGAWGDAFSANGGAGNPWLNTAVKSQPNLQFNTTGQNSVTNDVPVANVNKVGATLGNRPDYRNMAQVMAQAKFAKSVNPQVLWALLNPMITNAQSRYDALEQRAREQAGWDAAMAMEDKNLAPIELLRNGIATDQVKLADSIWNPAWSYSTINGGGTMYGSAFNPRTGEQKFVSETPVTMDENQRALLDLKERQFAHDKSMDYSNLGLKRAALRQRSSGGGGSSGKPTILSGWDGAKYMLGSDGKPILLLSGNPNAGKNSGKEELSSDEAYWDAELKAAERDLVYGKDIDEPQKEEIRRRMATAKMNKQEVTKRKQNGGQSNNSNIARSNTMLQLASGIMAENEGMSLEDALRAIELGYAQEYGL